MEPEILKKGKEFHKIVQSDWNNPITDGNINIEHTIRLISKSSGLKHIKKGRLDIFVDELTDMVSVIEIKSTDWNKIKPKNIKKLLGSHRRQVWSYVLNYLDVEKIDVCPGIIYPKAPISSKLKDCIEESLNEYGIQVVWYFD